MDDMSKTIVADVNALLQPVVDFFEQDDGGPYLSLAALVHQLGVELGSITPEPGEEGWISEDDLVSLASTLSRMIGEIKFLLHIVNAKVRVHLTDSEVKFSAREVLELIKKGE